MGMGDRGAAEALGLPAAGGVRVEGGSAKGARLVADRAFAAGETIGRLADAWITRKPSYLSIQISADTHAENLGPFSYLNHSCEPTTIVDAAGLAVRVARDVAAGEELSFFYPSTEWEMARPFRCVCGAEDCLGTISGAKDLPREVLERYAVAPHIQVLLAARDGRAADA